MAKYLESPNVPKFLFILTSNHLFLSFFSCYHFRLVGEYCRNLTVLNVHDCREITERSLQPLRSRMTIDRPLVTIPPYAKVNFPLNMPPI